MTITKSMWAVFNRIARAGVCHLTEETSYRLAVAVAILSHRGLVKIDWITYSDGYVAGKVSYLPEGVELAYNHPNRCF